MNHVPPPATPDQIVEALHDYGLTVVEWPGWRTRGTGHPFTPVGQAWHHDALLETVSDLRAAQVIFDQGRPDLRPPLANGTIGARSVVYLGAYGNANHAGWNETDVIDRLRRGLPPLDDARTDPDRDGIVGNPYLWGWECRNAGDGIDVWDQLDAMERAGAALCDANSWPPATNAAHRELTARKPDPRGFDMRAFRADIAHIQAAHHATPPEDDMALNQELKDHLDKIREDILVRIDGTPGVGVEEGTRSGIMPILTRILAGTEPTAGAVATLLVMARSAPDVDEAALAEALAPLLGFLLTQEHMATLTDDDVDRVAKAAADEADRRERERLST